MGDGRCSNVRHPTTEKTQRITFNDNTSPIISLRPNFKTEYECGVVVELNKNDIEITDESSVTVSILVDDNVYTE